MKFLRKWLGAFWRHIDTLILIGFGAYFTYRGFTGMPVEKLAPIMVGLLAGLAFSQLRSRRQVFGVAKSWRRARTELLLWAFPPEYEAARAIVAKNYFYAGITMARTLPLMSKHITRILDNGGSVRILLPNPRNPQLMAMIAASRPNKTEQAIRRSIEHSLVTAKELENSSQGTLEVYIFDSLPNIGINAMDLGRPGASIMVQMYEYAPKDEELPIFFLTGEDRMWLDYFAQRIERLWAAGTPYIQGP